MIYLLFYSLFTNRIILNKIHVRNMTVAISSIDVFDLPFEYWLFVINFLRSSIYFLLKGGLFNIIVFHAFFFPSNSVWHWRNCNSTYMHLYSFKYPNVMNVTCSFSIITFMIYNHCHTYTSYFSFDTISKN